MRFIVGVLGCRASAPKLPLASLAVSGRVGWFTDIPPFVSRLIGLRPLNVFGK